MAVDLMVGHHLGRAVEGGRDRQGHDARGHHLLGGAVEGTYVPSCSAAWAAAA